MLKEVSLLLLVIAVYYTSEVEADYKYAIAYNPKDYAKYTCPKNFNRVDLSYKNKQHWTLMRWGSKDSPYCAIRDTKAKCYSKGRGKKTWLTFKRGYGEFHVSKYEHFSDMSSSSSSSYPKPYKGKKGYGGKGGYKKNKGKYNKSPFSSGRYGKKGRYSGRSSSYQPFSSSFGKKKGRYSSSSSSDPYNNYGFKYGKYPSSKYGKSKKSKYPKSYKKGSSKYPSSGSYKKKGSKKYGGKYGNRFSSSDKFSSSLYGGKYGKPYSYGKKKYPSSSSGYYSSSNKYGKKGKKYGKKGKKYGKYPGYGKYPSSKSSSSSSSYGYGKYPSSGYKGYGKYPSSGYKGYGKYSSSGYKGYGKYPYSSSGKGRYNSRRGYSSSSSSSSSSGYSSSSSSYSNTAVPVDFAIRALYFKIRGVKELTIYFHGPITKVIKIKQGKELDPRKKTWICIQFDTLPVFRELWFTFKFGKNKKAKFWDLYIFSCCEVLNDKIKID